MFSRVGQRGTGLSATIARSEHEISEIIDGLSEQEVVLNTIFFKLPVICAKYCSPRRALTVLYSFYTYFIRFIIVFKALTRLKKKKFRVRWIMKSLHLVSVCYIFKSYTSSIRKKKTYIVPKILTLRLFTSTEQWETDETTISHSSHDVRLRAEASQVYQHEWPNGRPDEGVQSPAVYECLDRTRKGDL